MGSIDWSDFPAPSGSEFMKWREVGDKVVGVLTSETVGRNFDQTADQKELHFLTDDGDEIIVAVAQVMLDKALRAQTIDIGDRVSITYTGNGVATPGRTAPKQFDVKVKRGEPSVEAPAVKRPAVDAF